MNDSNPVMRFFAKPLVRRLGRLASYIFVGWYGFWVAVFTSIFVFFVLGLLLFGGGSAGAENPSSLGDLRYVFGDSNSANQILVIPVNGVIVGEGSYNPIGSLGGVASGYDIKQKLYDAAQRPEIKGVMLAIDSPGGTIFGARAIADGVKYYQDRTGQPVVAHIEGSGDSGAYWAASAADKIVADYGSDIGDIGVIMGPIKYYDKVLSEDGGLLQGGVVTQNGIQTTYITAGQSKDLGNPYRKLTTDERQKLQQGVNNEYDNFVSFVSQRRKIPEDTIRNKIGAFAYDNETAQNYHLIDATNSREKTYAMVAQMSGVKDYEVVSENQSSGLLSSLLGAVHKAPQKQSESLCTITSTPLAFGGNVDALCQSTN